MNYDFWITIDIRFTNGLSINIHNSKIKKNEISNKNTDNNQEDSIKDKLKKLKALFEDDLITQDEYDAKRKEILDAM